MTACEVLKISLFITLMATQRLFLDHSDSRENNFSIDSKIDYSVLTFFDSISWHSHCLHALNAIEDRTQTFDLTVWDNWHLYADIQLIISYDQFLADRTNGRAYATVLRLSVCDVMYCG